MLKLTLEIIRKRKSTELNVRQIPGSEMHFFVLGYGRDEVEVHKNAEKELGSNKLAQEKKNSTRTSLVKRKELGLNKLGQESL